jgi:hypothetical protein
VEIIVLIIRDDKLNVGNNKVASSKVAKKEGCTGKLWQLWFPRDERISGHGKLLNFNYNYYIQILLININSLIYIFYILCRG